MKITIEVIDNAWLVRTPKEARVFHIWNTLIAFLETVLSDKERVNG